jgi:hypothetical protein
MQMIKRLLGAIVLSCSINVCLAAPPFQILRTCMDINPYNNKVKMTRLDGEGYADHSLQGCQDQYDRSINGHIYGSLTCNDKFYLIINDKKVDPEKARNMSINPEIQPGVEFTTRALWYKIDYENKEYLCILAPLSEQGVGSAHNQYYIIENAFDNKLNSELYFYFFDKNIAPITSKTL